MALRARLSAPAEKPKQTWRWHDVKAKLVPVSFMTDSNRRLAARHYLSSGYGIRKAIESKPSGWVYLEQIAKLRQPPRTKSVVLPTGQGTPFLIANQMFDLRPQVRKWLAVKHLPHADELFVRRGTIIVRRSADVGRSTLTCAQHEDHLVSDHFFRVEPINDDLYGWIYAFIKSDRARMIMVGDQYGHIIQHIERRHFRQIPIPLVDAATAAAFNKQADNIIEQRERSHRLIREAEERFENALAPITIRDWGERGFSTSASSSVFGGRRRMEAAAHNPGVAAIRRHLAQHGEGFTALRDAGYDVWLPSRFKRIASEDGVLLLDTSAIGAVNPQPSKRIKDGDFGDPFAGRVRKGWILMPRSGQVYGILGTPTLALESWQDFVVSDDAIRVRPKSSHSVPSGYVNIALGHPTLGRPLVKSLAYGSSIPHIEPNDLASFELVRVGDSEEAAIARLAEESADAREEADLIEQEIAADAGAIIDRFTT